MAELSRSSDRKAYTLPFIGSLSHSPPLLLKRALSHSKNSGGSDERFPERSGGPEAKVGRHCLTEQ